MKAALAGRSGYSIEDSARKYAFVDDDIQERLDVRKLLRTTARASPAGIRIDRCSPTPNRFS
ncbi:MAG TPA: hypothetical protein VK841_03640 [Polyangiaceae bacterium]|nr:hypothetical protein [Polyangiaceae bacterium]